MRTARQPAGGVFDQLAQRLRQMVREVHVNELSGVERFTVASMSPFTIQEVQGELVLEDGDPDFTIGETLRSWIATGAPRLEVGSLVWVARHDREWHAFDAVGAGANVPFPDPDPV